MVFFWVFACPFCDKKGTWGRSEAGIGGQNVPKARGGWELTRKLSLESLDFWPPNCGFFYRISVERVKNQGPPKIQSFHPPSNFRRFDPPIPISKSGSQRVLRASDEAAVLARELASAEAQSAAAEVMIQVASNFQCKSIAAKHMRTNTPPPSILTSETARRQ